eukprot:g6855.t1
MAAVVRGFVALLASSAGPAFDYCIIGAGPAGLQLAYYLQTTVPAPRSYVVFERNARAGSYFATYPRHRKLISINKRFTGSDNFEFNMRHDWNSLLTREPEPGLLFREFDQEYFPHADSMVRYLGNYSARWGLNVRFNTTVASVQREQGSGRGRGRDRFSLQLRHGDNTGSRARCARVVVATGLWKPARVNPSPLIEYYDEMSVNKTEFENQRVLIIGRGNAAFETAAHLYGVTARVNLIGRSRVRLSWETHYPGDLRGVNNEVIDSYMLKSLDVVQSAKCASLLRFVRNQTSRKIDVFHADEPAEPANLALGPVDRIIACTGWAFDSAPLRAGGLRPAMLTAKYPRLTPEFESVSEPGLFFAGALAHGRDWRKSSGGFVHGFRYTVRVLHRALERRFHGVPWPAAALPLPGTSSAGSEQGSNSAAAAASASRALQAALLRRVNEAAAPYQMFAYLYDVVVLVALADQPRNYTARYLEEVPADGVPELVDSQYPQARRYFTLGFEYGKGFSGPGNDTLDPNNVHEPDFDSRDGPGSTAFFLHPVVRLHRAGPHVARSLRRATCTDPAQQDPERPRSACWEETVHGKGDSERDSEEDDGYEWREDEVDEAEAEL